MYIARSGTQPSQKGPAEWFTGSVRIDPLFQASDPSRTSGALVTFEPGARVSMEPYARRAALPRGSGARVPRTDFVARADAPGYAIAIDPSGKLRWESGAIDEDHAVTVLTQRVPDRSLTFLRERGVSYLFGGRDRIDVPAVLRKLCERFGIRRLLLEGGGKINGSFLATGCIDELSLLVAPIADGRVGTPTLFDAPAAAPAVRLQLASAQRRPGGLVWLRYRVRRP